MGRTHANECFGALFAAKLVAQRDGPEDHIPHLPGDARYSGIDLQRTTIVRHDPSLRQYPEHAVTSFAQQTTDVGNRPLRLAGAAPVDRKCAAPGEEPVHAQLFLFHHNVTLEPLVEHDLVHQERHVAIPPSWMVHVDNNRALGRMGNRTLNGNPDPIEHRATGGQHQCAIDQFLPDCVAIRRDGRSGVLQDSRLRFSDAHMKRCGV